MCDHCCEASVPQGTEAALRNNKKNIPAKVWEVFLSDIPGVSFLEVETAMKTACSVAVLLYRMELHKSVEFRLKT